MKRWVSGAAMELTATIEPPPFAARPMTACFRVRNAPVRLVPMTAFQSSSVVR